jgi:hypothetical protein
LLTKLFMFFADQVVEKMPEREDEIQPKLNLQLIRKRAKPTIPTRGATKSRMLAIGLQLNVG